MTNRDRMVLVEGPAGTGKSRAILEKLHACMVKYPGARALIIRKTRASLSETTLKTFEENVLSEHDPLHDGADREHRQHYEYPNGSRIVCGGLDRPTRYYSGEYDIVYIGEAIEVARDEAQSLLRSLRNNVMPYQQLIMDTNPGSPRHWLNMDADAGKLPRIRTVHADNPSVTEAYLATLAAMDGVLYRRLFLGEWVAADGTVYQLLDAHLGDDLFQADKPTQVAVDPSNGSGPYAALVLQQVGPRVLVVDEFYRVGGMDEDLRDWLLASRYHARLAGVVCDPAKPDTIKRLRAMLNVPVAAKEGAKDIVAQVSAVKSLMVVDPVTKVSPLVVDRGRCPMLLDEFSRYAWRKPPTTQPDRNAPDMPEDAHNHCLDALAYWVTAKALTGTQRQQSWNRPSRTEAPAWVRRSA